MVRASHDLLFLLYVSFTFYTKVDLRNMPHDQMEQALISSLSHSGSKQYLLKIIAGLLCRQEGHHGCHHLTGVFVLILILLFQGLDWHGLSAAEAWATVDALQEILRKRNSSWSVDIKKVLIMGHSNGGQGAWYTASRHPDRVIGGNLPALLIGSGSRSG